MGEVVEQQRYWALVEQHRRLTRSGQHMRRRVLDPDQHGRRVLVQRDQYGWPAYASSTRPPPPLLALLLCLRRFHQLLLCLRRFHQSLLCLRRFHQLRCFHQLRRFQQSLLCLRCFHQLRCVQPGIVPDFGACQPGCLLRHRVRLPSESGVGAHTLSVLRACVCVCVWVLLLLLQLQQPLLLSPVLSLAVGDPRCQLLSRSRRRQLLSRGPVVIAAAIAWGWGGGGG